MIKSKKKKSPKKVIIISILAILMWIFGFYIYVTYQKIEIDTNNYKAIRTEFTQEEQNVEDIEENSKKVADVLEETIKSVVGISKLKSTGSSILSKSTETELGLGTGFIVTENGYIVSNSHVTGERYSKCYITLENGSTYDGTVVWNDNDLDLSITKINAKNLEYVELGNSDEIRIGETVYAIRKSYRF